MSQYVIHLVLDTDGCGTKKQATLPPCANKRDGIKAMSELKHQWRRGAFAGALTDTNARTGFGAHKAGTYGVGEAAFIGNFRGKTRLRATLIKNIEGAAS